MFTNFSSFDSEDFSKTVLSWDFETLSHPLKIAMQQAPLPEVEYNVAQYYANFLPFILEEARAIINDGLERVYKYERSTRADRNSSYLSDAKPFNLTLNKQTHLPKTEGNPMSMTFRGSIPDKIEHGSAMNVLLLKTQGMEFIGLATESQGHADLFVKIIIASSDYDDYKRCFSDGWQWQAHYLGSVISEQRMYDICLEATDCACVQQIARAHIQPLMTRIPAGSLNINHLNLAQKEAIYAFLNAREGSTTVLQGPPGTGKTTTLVALLKKVAEEGQRTLVSAHSNKGVQVLALRAMEDMADIPMILVGVESKVPDKLRPLFLNGWHQMIFSSLSCRHDDLERLAESGSNPRFSRIDLVAEIEQNVRFVQQALNKFTLIYSRQLSSADQETLLELTCDPVSTSDFLNLQNQIDSLRRQLQSRGLWRELLTILNRLVDKWTRIGREALESYLLDGASIIFATLISAGRKTLLNMAPIDFLLVDEAAQSVEAATLIPMRFQPKKVLLVGDTKQLPATVISRVLDNSRSVAKHYQWSMMWRLIEENQQPNLMLDIQYRMHPQICQWPSGQYYADRLMTSPDILPMPLLDSTNITSRPYAIYQVLGQAESRDGSSSICNTQEAQYVVRIVEHIRQKNKVNTIGVITPYAAQKRLINDHLLRKGLQKRVDVNTVDGFQGDERDIILISFTRTHVSEFLKEFRRLNVAITRAKSCLIILSAPSLLSNDIGKLMADARRRNVLYSEQELNNILSNGMVPTQPQNPADLLTLAWRNNPTAQLDYAKSIYDQTKKILWYRRAAENNHAEAQCYIGQVYLLGNEITKKDIQLGIAWLNKSSRQNFPMANYVLGWHCVSGGILIKNISLGIDLCKRAANSDLIEAIFFLAKLYDDGIEVLRNAKQAEKYYRQAAKLEDLRSALRLAELLSDGTLDNQREALKWYQKFAARKITETYYPLAHLLDGIFNKQTEALVWYSKAAECGHKEAQYELGLRFKNGTHECTVDIVQATHFFKLAAFSQHVKAQFMYAISLKEEGNSIEAMRFFQSAADQGHCEAQYQFALLTSNSDRHKAYSYYLKAAQQNHTLAQYECIRYQIQFNRDLTSCLHFCETLTLSVQGNSEVQFLLARLLDTGLAGRIDKQQAYHYYLRLVQDGHTLAQYCCAILLERGIGVARDLGAARRYYEISLEQHFGARLRLACLLLRQAEDAQRAIELLEYYCQHYPKEKSSGNTSEHHLEDLILKSQNSIDHIEVIDTPSAQANYLLGKIFQEGIGITVDIKRGLQHYQLASTQHSDTIYRAGYINAQFMYANALKTEGNRSEAIRFFQSAADQGHCEAQYQFALLTSNSDRHKAYSYYLKAAQQNHTLAQYECIRYQIQFNRDLTSCLHFCETLTLSVQGNSEVQFLLARLLDTGLAERIDKQQAYHYYLRLAQDGHTLAQYCCAILLERGVGIDQDIDAARWYYEACLEQHFGARLRLACLLLREKDRELGRQSVHVERAETNLQAENFQKPIALLEYYCQYYREEKFLNITEHYLERLVLESPANSTHNIETVNTRSAQANYLLGKIFQEGIGVAVNVKRALQHYQLASTQHAEASYRVGYIHEAGLSVVKNSSVANEYYKNAADKGHELAAKRLTWSYSLFTRGVPDDETLRKTESNKCSVM